MIESYLADGRQNRPIFGCSITDPCLGWENTVALVENLYYLNKISEKDGVGGISTPFENDSWTRIDIEALASIQNTVEKREGFARRVLTDKEMEPLPVLKVVGRSSIWLGVGQLKLSQGSRDRDWEAGLSGFGNLEQ